MPRTDISLTPAELGEFLGSCRTAAIAVQGADGWPIAALGHTSLESGQFRVGVDPDSPLGVAIQAGEHVCLVADTWPSYAGIQGVIIRGQGVADPTGAHPAAAPETDTGTDTLLAVRHLISFDFGKAT